MAILQMALSAIEQTIRACDFDENRWINRFLSALLLLFTFHFAFHHRNGYVKPPSANVAAEKFKSHCTASFFTGLHHLFQLFISSALFHKSGLIEAQKQSTGSLCWLSYLACLFVRASLCVWRRAGPGKTQWLTIDGETITALFLAFRYTLYHSPHPAPSIYLPKYCCKLCVFCKHCNVAAKTLINRKRQRWAVRFNLEHVKWGVKKTR